jgi:hypothetical protein
MENMMKKFVFVLASLGVMAATVPASAQVGVTLGTNGPPIRFGDSFDGDYAAGRNMPMRDWRWQNGSGYAGGYGYADGYGYAGRACNTVWHHHHRMTVCR